MKQTKTLKDFVNKDHFDLRKYVNFLLKGQEETVESRKLVKL